MSFILYLLRWQMSSPILYLCLSKLNLGTFWNTIIANLVGGIIFYFVDKRIFKEEGKKMSRTPYVYALYKGDEFIDLGTKKELAKRHNVNERTIGYLTTPRWKRKRNENNLIAIKIGRIDDDLEAKDE